MNFLVVCKDGVSKEEIFELSSLKLPGYSVINKRLWKIASEGKVFHFVSIFEIETGCPIRKDEEIITEDTLLHYLKENE